MYRKKSFDRQNYEETSISDTESITCCQLDVHKKKIREQSE